ncbi:MAG: 4-hydroxybenzoate octaprenyltransferase [Proteobacteria bacterium]|nr:4-hydroxybenzoate octaprenyltransferase [Pseudomonadota bacterium]
MKSKLWQKMQLYGELIRIEKPVGIYLLLWPTLWALAVAGEGAPDLKVLLIFVAGVFLMRSAGCAINDFADRHIDLHVARTRDRPLTSGRIGEKEVLMVFAVLCSLAFLLVLSLNRFTIWLSIGGVLIAASYPFMKRYHYLPQVHLGAAFGWSVLMAFAAQTESLPRQAWLLYVATLVWAVAYDTMYSMADREDDLKIGVKSTAILFGEFDRAMIGLFQILFILTLWLMGRELAFSGIYFYSLAVAAVFLIYEQLMIMWREPEDCFLAFQHNHWVGAIVFGGIIGHYYLA